MSPRISHVDINGEHQWEFTPEELMALLAPYGSVGDPIPAGVVVPEGQGIPAGIQCCVVAVDIKRRRRSAG